MLTAEMANELLAYDPATGALTWKTAIRPAIRPGDPAGRGKPNSAGYLRVGIDGRSYLQHRVIWLMVTGEWPPQEIDHRDRDRANNRWANLRAASPSQNVANTARRNAPTGSNRGVSYDHRKKAWRAYATKNGRQYFGGYFKYDHQAAAAATALRNRLHGEFAHHG